MIISSQINSCLNRNKIKHRCSYVFRDRAKKIVLSVVCRSHAHSSIVVTQESAVFERIQPVRGLVQEVKWNAPFYKEEGKFFVASK